jgi:glycosyltransferase involved in cell wall biosynthesis
MNLSVIIPIHNAARHLNECLASVLRLDAVGEVVCIDDGSADSSGAILDDYASRDSRIRVLRQDRRGAGAARNAGLAVARGDGLWFVDADDRIDGATILPALREAAAAAIPPDVILFNADEFDARTQWRTPVPLRIGRAETRTDPRWLASCGTAPWNKIFRRAFVERHGLRFQEIARTNDAAFVATALCLAQSIHVVPAVGYVYQINAGGSLQQTNASSPLCFYDAVTEIAARLKAHDVFAANEAAFKFLALRMIVGNVFSLRSPETFAQVCAFLRTRGDEFGLLDASNLPVPHFLFATYRAILRGDLPNRALGRIAFSIYNRGFLSFAKHVVGRLKK